jgi:hypothetical protein
LNSSEADAGSTSLTTVTLYLVSLPWLSVPVTLNVVPTGPLFGSDGVGAGVVGAGAVVAGAGALVLAGGAAFVTLPVEQAASPPPSAAATAAALIVLTVVLMLRHRFAGSVPPPDAIGLCNLMITLRDLLRVRLT